MHAANIDICQFGFCIDLRWKPAYILLQHFSMQPPASKRVCVQGWVSVAGSGRGFCTRPTGFWEGLALSGWIGALRVAARQRAVLGPGARQPEPLLRQPESPGDTSPRQTPPSLLLGGVWHMATAQALTLPGSGSLPRL